MTLETTWFFLWGLLWAMYFLADGFDLGIGMLLPFIAKGEKEKRMLLQRHRPGLERQRGLADHGRGRNLCGLSEDLRDPVQLAVYRDDTAAGGADPSGDLPGIPQQGRWGGRQVAERRGPVYRQRPCRTADRRCIRQYLPRPAAGKRRLSRLLPGPAEPLWPDGRRLLHGDLPAARVRVAGRQDRRRIAAKGLSGRGWAVGGCTDLDGGLSGLQFLRDKAVC